MPKRKPRLSPLVDSVERKEKKRILSVLELERLDLVHAARKIARILWTHNEEPVTAGAVFEAMAQVNGMKPILARHDKRWLGAVFNSQWQKVGFSMTGSHCRPVSQWIPIEHKDQFKPFKQSEHSKQ